MVKQVSGDVENEVGVGRGEVDIVCVGGRGG